MTLTAKTETEAHDIAAQLRAIHAGTDWAVTVYGPLFDGDLFRVVVG